MEQPRKRGEKTERKSRDEFRTGGKYTPKLLGKAYFQRRRGCPFSGPKAPKIDYKDVRLLGKYLSEYGKILPRHITGVCAEKQRELTQAIKRARMLALLPYTVKFDPQNDRPARTPRGPREGREPREPREPRAEASTEAAE
ncbi:MAG: 30S ribosomal protein S18 [Blastochloris viridis]|uniref:Small ribosomal subunit protein bS18 n=1 Tax=Blastochloris viridis TaxID=1079 RepID=A0A6N4RCJ7_BLAVI|nr:MAG: 30S ribosomal protein S18 [Blastochloris viridis]